jgi:hypothetical protein
MRTMIRSTRVAFAATAVVVGLFGSLTISPNGPGPLVSGSVATSAHAIIGRPLTPMSYAGVARRSAVGVGVGYGAVVVGAPVVVAPVPVCAQVVNVYGQITTVCR